MPVPVSTSLTLVPYQATVPGGNCTSTVCAAVLACTTFRADGSSVAGGIRVAICCAADGAQPATRRVLAQSCVRFASREAAGPVQSVQGGGGSRRLRKQDRHQLRRAGVPGHAELHQEPPSDRGGERAPSALRSVPRSACFWPFWIFWIGMMRRKGCKGCKGCDDNES